MDIWPEVDLTEYERLFVRTYKTIASKMVGKKRQTVVMPGVLKRVYTKFLVNQADENSEFFNAPIFETSIKISRRARIFGIVFTGDVHAWSVRLQNSAGTLYTVNNAPNSDNRILVSSMVEGSGYNFFSQQGIPPEEIPDLEALQQGSQSYPLLVEPNFELMQNDTFMINGLCHYEGTPLPFGILGITLHVWEFPGMESNTASRAG